MHRTFMILRITAPLFLFSAELAVIHCRLIPEMRFLQQGAQQGRPAALDARCLLLAIFTNTFA